MDEAYNQHSQHARRKNRSSTSLNRLSLAPLTTRLPLADDEILAEALAAPAALYNMSYLQGKSAPSTPSLLSRSPARSRSGDRRMLLPRSSAAAAAPERALLPKSRSTTHLGSGRGAAAAVSGAVLANTGRRRRGRGDDPQAVSAADRSDSDWLLRAGALISNETREFKGQAWLATRASSTAWPACGMSRRKSTSARWPARGSSPAATPAATPAGAVAWMVPCPPPPQGGSRRGSRPQSRAGSRTQMMTPLEKQRPVDGYFPYLSTTTATTRRQRRRHSRPGLCQPGSETGGHRAGHDCRRRRPRPAARETREGVHWRLAGERHRWTLFSVQENDEEEEEEDEGSDEGGEEPGAELDEDEDEDELSGPSGWRRSGLRHFEGVSNLAEDKIPPAQLGRGRLARRGMAAECGIKGHPLRASELGKRPGRRRTCLPSRPAEGKPALGRDRATCRASKHLSAVWPRPEHRERKKEGRSSPALGYPEASRLGNGSQAEPGTRRFRGQGGRGLASVARPWPVLDNSHRGASRRRWKLLARRKQGPSRGTF